jgi:flagellar biosynthesis regulator FlaF
MKGIRWQLALGFALVALSAILYFAHYSIFHDAHHIFIYLLGDVAFVPIEVLLVTLIIHRLLSAREKRMRMQKLNMVIGTFFSEVGTHLLASLSDRDPALDEIRKDLIITGQWTDKEFERVLRRLRNYAYMVDMPRINLAELEDFLTARRDFLVRLLENPLLLDHEAFTGLLRAVFHLAEELQARDDFLRLPETDIEHLGGDIHRTYQRLVFQWLQYMKYLKATHPYLFSLAMRTNPFDRTTTAVVT